MVCCDLHQGLKLFQKCRQSCWNDEYIIGYDYA